MSKFDEFNDRIADTDRVLTRLLEIKKDLDDSCEKFEKALTAKDDDMVGLIQRGIAKEADNIELYLENLEEYYDYFQETGDLLEDLLDRGGEWFDGEELGNKLSRYMTRASFKVDDLDDTQLYFSFLRNVILDYPDEYGDDEEFLSILSEALKAFSDEFEEK